jgi:hypothetical protein
VIPLEGISMRVVIIAGAILAAFGGVACAGGAEPLDFTDGYGPYVARSTYLIVFAPQPTGGPLTWWSVRFVAGMP